MSENNSRLQELFLKEMTRQQFIAALALGLVSLFGFSNIIEVLTRPNASKSSGHGFGSGGFGN